MAHTSPHAASARPPLASLETVCHVAREGSFLAAAEAAGLTHGAISRTGSVLLGGSSRLSALSTALRTSGVRRAARNWSS
jgi:hypothetical protein